MSDLVPKLKILLRAEKALYKADASRRANALILNAVAGGCVIVALAFANMGLFFLLTDATDSARAAGTLTALNLVIAALPLLLARRLGPGKEEAMLQELRDLTLDEVTRELEQLAETITSAGADVKALISGDHAVSSTLRALSPALSFAIDILNNEPTEQGADRGPGTQRDTDL